MVNVKSGKDWIPKWEAKVVMATGASLVMQRWSDNLYLLGQSKTEMASQEFRVRVEFIEINEFSERYPTTKSKTSKSTKENRKPKDGEGGKDTQDGKGGKDHHSSLPSRSVPSKPNLSHLLIPKGSGIEKNQYFPMFKYQSFWVSISCFQGPFNIDMKY